MRPVIFYNNRAHPTSSRLAAAAVRPQMIVFNFLIRYNYYNTYISDVNLFLIYCNSSAPTIRKTALTPLLWLNSCYIFPPHFVLSYT